jgi:large conductance mechanosensitive channel
MPPEKPKNFIEEFKEFLKHYNVMGLAVAFIMGLYLGRLVQQLVTSFITPILSFIFVTLTWQLPPIVPFTPVNFITELITFIIVAFVIFIIIKLTSRMGIK